MINEFKQRSYHYAKQIGLYYVILWIASGHRYIKDATHFGISIRNRDREELSLEELKKIGIVYKQTGTYINIPRKEVENILKILSGNIIGNF